ncbi:ABC transporter permease [Leptolyngbya sp. 7M]|uniref:ABC transporter permease n=1 Tax=Leptolyngbya sp. 7M TaxID=2812896 RepID=UPI001B8BCCF9|nr:ABC transporter permease [Leptolyngbya sp. 7M]QYO67627.1 ABC transporter permease [Leptolyngbya sp. 7M]
MLKFVLRKLAQGVATVIIVAGITFALLSAAGGDAFTALRDNPQVSERTIEELRRVYGLDRPLPVRFASWISGAVLGKLGESIVFRVPVSTLVAARLLNTFYLAAVSVMIALFFAVMISILAARYPKGWVFWTVEAVVLLTISTPRIVLSLLALLLIASAAGTRFAIGGGSIAMFLLTALALAIPLIGVFVAQTNEQLQLAMKEDFVKLARAKGLSEWVVIAKHAFRAAVNPLIALTGTSIGALLGGSVIVEAILGWPGIGSLAVAAVKGRDVPLVMGVVLIASLAVWLGNALAEVAQLYNDKRLAPDR